MPPPPLLPGEKEADYATIAARIVSASGPGDAIEEFLIRDVVDLTWEILRLRRAKAGILKSSMGDGVRNFLFSVGLALESTTLSLGWAAGDDCARNKLDAILTRAGLTIDEVTARTLESKLNSFERLDRMLASAEARRNNALREIDRHREALGGACVNRSRKSRTWSSETSRRAKLQQEDSLDERSPAARQSSQRQGEHRSQDPGWQAACGAERVAARLEHSRLQRFGAFAHVEAIARRIAGPDAKAEALEQARRIGEAQVDLNRVRARRMALVTDRLGDPNYQPLSVLKHSVRLMRLVDRIKGLALPASDAEMFESAINCKPLEGLEKLAMILEDRALELARLDRYERRALSRRKSAIREFDAARALTKL